MLAFKIFSLIFYDIFYGYLILSEKETFENKKTRNIFIIVLSLSILLNDLLVITEQLSICLFISILNIFIIYFSTVLFTDNQILCRTIKLPNFVTLGINLIFALIYIVDVITKTSIDSEIELFNDWYPFYLILFVIVSFIIYFISIRLGRKYGLKNKKRISSKRK